MEYYVFDNNDQPILSGIYENFTYDSNIDKLLKGEWIEKTVKYKIFKYELKLKVKSGKEYKSEPLFTI